MNETLDHFANPQTLLDTGRQERLESSMTRLFGPSTEEQRKKTLQFADKASEEAKEVETLAEGLGLEFSSGNFEERMNELRAELYEDDISKEEMAAIEEEISYQYGICSALKGALVELHAATTGVNLGAPEMTEEAADNMQVALTTFDELMISPSLEAFDALMDSANTAAGFLAAIEAINSIPDAAVGQIFSDENLAMMAKQESPSTRAGVGLAMIEEYYESLEIPDVAKARPELIIERMEKAGILDEKTLKEAGLIGLTAKMRRAGARMQRGELTFEDGREEIIGILSEAAFNRSKEVSEGLISGIKETLAGSINLDAGKEEARAEYIKRRSDEETFKAVMERDEYGMEAPKYTSKDELNLEFEKEWAQYKREQQKQWLEAIDLALSVSGELTAEIDSIKGTRSFKELLDKQQSLTDKLNGDGGSRYSLRSLVDLSLCASSYLTGRELALNLAQDPGMRQVTRVASREFVDKGFAERVSSASGGIRADKNALETLRKRMDEQVAGLKDTVIQAEGWNGIAKFYTTVSIIMLAAMTGGAAAEAAVEFGLVSEGGIGAFFIDSTVFGLMDNAASGATPWDSYPKTWGEFAKKMVHTYATFGSLRGTGKVLGMLRGDAKMGWEIINDAERFAKLDVNAANVTKEMRAVATALGGNVSAADAIVTDALQIMNSHLTLQGTSAALGTIGMGEVPQSLGTWEDLLTLAILHGHGKLKDQNREKKFTTVERVKHGDPAVFARTAANAEASGLRVEYGRNSFRIYGETVNRRGEPVEKLVAVHRLRIPITKAPAKAQAKAPAVGKEESAVSTERVLIEPAGKSMPEVDPEATNPDGIAAISRGPRSEPRGAADGTVRGGRESENDIEMGFEYYADPRDGAGYSPDDGWAYVDFEATSEGSPVGVRNKGRTGPRREFVPIPNYAGNDNLTIVLPRGVSSSTPSPALTGGKRYIKFEVPYGISDKDVLESDKPSDGAEIRRPEELVTKGYYDVVEVKLADGRSVIYDARDYAPQRAVGDDPVIYMHGGFDPRPGLKQGWEMLKKGWRELTGGNKPPMTEQIQTEQRGPEPKTIAPSGIAPSEIAESAAPTLKPQGRARDGAEGNGSDKASTVQDERSEPVVEEPQDAAYPVAPQTLPAEQRQAERDSLEKRLMALNNFATGYVETRPDMGRVESHYRGLENWRNAFYQKVARDAAKYPEFTPQELLERAYQVIERNGVLELLPNGLREEAARYMKFAIGLAAELYPEDMNASYALGQNPYSAEGVFEGTFEAKYRLARTVLAYYAGLPPLGVPSGAEQKAALKLADRYFKADEDGFVNYITAQKAMRDNVELETPAFKQFLKGATAEEKKLFLHTYFGLYSGRVVTDVGLAMRLGRLIGDAGMYRETGVTLEVTNGKFTAHFALGGINEVGGEGHVGLLHSHPQLFLDANGHTVGDTKETMAIDMDKAGLSGALSILIPSRTDIITAIGSARLVQNNWRPEYGKTFFWDPGTGTFTSWMPHPMGVFKLCVTLDAKGNVEAVSAEIGVKESVRSPDSYVPKGRGEYVTMNGEKFLLSYTNMRSYDDLMNDFPKEFIPPDIGGASFTGRSEPLVQRSGGDARTSTDAGGVGDNAIIAKASEYWPSISVMKGEQGVVVNGRKAEGLVTLAGTSGIKFLTGEPYFIGSDPGSDLRITGAKDVLPRHATMVKRGEKYYISAVDGSKILVNGREIGRQEVELKAGDEIRLSDAVIVFFPEGKVPKGLLKTPKKGIDVPAKAPPVREKTSDVVQRAETGIANLKFYLQRGELERGYRQTGVKAYISGVDRVVSGIESNIASLERLGATDEAARLRGEMWSVMQENGMIVDGEFVPVVPLSELVKGVFFSDTFREVVGEFIRRPEFYKEFEDEGPAGAVAAANTGAFYKGYNGSATLARASTPLADKNNRLELPESHRSKKVFGPIMQNPNDPGGFAFYKYLKGLKNGEIEGRLYISLLPERYADKAPELVELLIKEMENDPNRSFEFKVYRSTKGTKRRDHIVVYFNSVDQKAVSAAVNRALNKLGDGVLSAKGPRLTKKIRDGLFFAEEPHEDGQSFGGLVSKATKMAWELIESYESTYGVVLSEDARMKILAYCFDKYGIDTNDPAFMKGGQKKFYYFSGEAGDFEPPVKEAPVKEAPISENFVPGSARHRLSIALPWLVKEISGVEVKMRGLSRAEQAFMEMVEVELERAAKNKREGKSVELYPNVVAFLNEHLVGARIAPDGRVL